MKKENPYHLQVKSAIEKLKLNESINKYQLIKSIWGEHDYFIGRSFDATLAVAKKKLNAELEKNQQPLRKFKSKMGKLVRTE